MEKQSPEAARSKNQDKKKHTAVRLVVIVLLMTNLFTLLVACVALVALARQSALRMEADRIARVPDAKAVETRQHAERQRADRIRDARAAVVPAQTAEENEPEPETIEGTVTKMAGLITDLRVAGGGKWVVLRMQASSDLAIYDTGEMKIVRTLRLGDSEFRFSAGGNVVLAYYPGTNLLESWDIESGNKLKSRLNPKGVQITNITMGCSNDKKALIRYATSTEALGHVGLFFLNVDTLQEFAFENKELSPHNRNYRNIVHQRADSQMQTISEWATSHSPSGLGLFRLSGDAWTFRYEHDTVGYIAVGDDGHLYTGNGGVYNQELTRIHSLKGVWPIPGIGGALFLGLSSDGQMQVYQAGAATPIVSVGRFPGSLEAMGDLARHRNSLSLDRHVVFAPERAYLLLVPPEHDRIVQRDFDLEKTVQDAGVEYLVFMSKPDRDITPGQTWQYKLQAISSASGITFMLESAPPEMVLGADNTISWRVPFDQGPSESVVIRVEDESGQTAFQKIELHNTRKAGSVPESRGTSKGVSISL